MADFEVKVRDLRSGETMVATMTDAAHCAEWLTERPPFIEVLGVLSDTSPAEQLRLKEAMRPYDAEEMKLKAAYDKRTADALQAQYAAELAQMEQAPKQVEDPNADPNRPLAVRYEMNEGLRVVEDTREITDAARDACLAWVAERNTWIADKGQIIGEAHLEVWPNEIPDGDETKRVREGGRFFPRLKDDA